MPILRKDDKDEALESLSDNARASIVALGAALAGVVVGSAALLSSWLLNRLLDLFGSN